MMGFKGNALYAVDGKGRVAIPAKMRAVLTPEANNTFVLTRGFENCITLYPLDRWSEMMAEIKKLNSYKKEVRAFIRFITMHAEECQLDGQGRVVLPKSLMEYATLSERAVIIGALDHIEIWSPDELEKAQREQEENFETLAERVMSL